MNSSEIVIFDTLKSKIKLIDESEFNTLQISNYDMNYIFLKEYNKYIEITLN